MKKINVFRRRFIQSLGALSVTGALPLPLTRRVHAASDTDDHVLIVVHLDGGCDGLNMIVPFADPGYAAARPSLAIPADTTLKISDALGFHPAMTGIKSWYDQGKVTIVNGVGYPGFVLSHFSAEDIYWTASTTDTQQPTGWLGRVLDLQSAPSVLSGTSLESRPPKSMAAAKFAAPTIPSAEKYLLQTPANPTEAYAHSLALEAIFGQSSTGEAQFDGLLARDMAAVQSIELVQAAVTSYVSPIAYGTDDFARSLKLAGQLIHARLGVKLMTLSLGGFDTHANQAETLATLLGQFSTGVDQFMQDAVVGGFSNKVTILVWTEFGRRVAENASGGTDHGTAAPMLLMGAGVHGGIANNYPSLTDLDGGNLKMAVDFRSVYSTVLSEWLGIDAATVLGGEWEKLAFFDKPAVGALVNQF
jgi:uncharacterized protein (DUF1501 family)